MESKKKTKQEKIEAKKARKSAYKTWVANNKKHKQEKERIVLLYDSKLKEIKKKYKNDVFNNPKNKKVIRKQYLDDRFNLINQRDYALANCEITESAKNSKKMKVDKRIAFNKYKIAFATLQTENKFHHSEIVKNYKNSKAKNDKDLKVFNKQNKKNNSEYQLLIQKKQDIKNNYEAQLINNKIWYRNNLVQLKTRRDISYQYELDHNYLIKRWFYGIGKEFQRMSWPSTRKTVRDFFIVIAVSGSIALFFLLIDYIIGLL